MKAATEVANPRNKPAPHDKIIAPLCEGALILCVGVVGVLSHSALLFSSLGATAFEQIEKSRSRSARPYNVIVGHISGIICAFIAVALLGVWSHPAVLSTHSLPTARVWAAVLAVSLTVVLNQFIKAQQPAACSTTLLVALGSFSSPRQAALLISGVLVVAVLGELVRQLRIRTTPADTLF